MFESIIQEAKKTEYDFRLTANLEDPLLHLFDEWVDYYKLKWAIARVLKPASILEIGVRFGYSAAAFLNGYSTAKYVGIDLDTDSYGGVKGAINWAKKITQPFEAEFIVADTQAMNSFPGDIYDLIHIDGQQDGDGSFHDLELAIKQGRYVLVDGYLWTRQNFMAVSDFLFRYADLLDWFGVIPGYAGDLLIKVAPEYHRQVFESKYSTVPSSLAIRHTYTTNYYTQDCGGYEAFNRHQGKKLEDVRLQAVATIASLKKSGRVLDLGCGRGELSYYFAHQGFGVTAVDYAQSAIDLAKKCFDGEEQLQAKVEFICDDVCNLKLSGKYDLAVASDLIEHLSSQEVEKLYQNIANNLKTDGLFVVHTFPNLWYYQYDYARKRRIAASVGAYLSPEPRSRYELLMHINEQSPRILKRQLNKCFKYVYLWFGDTFNPGGSLVKKYSLREICAAPSLFAIASHQPIAQEQLKNLLQMPPLPPLPSGQIQLSAIDYPQTVEVNTEFTIQLKIENCSEFILHSYGSNPVHISYHWLNTQTHDCVVFEGARTKLFPPLDSCKRTVWNPWAKNVAKRIYTARVQAPPQEGKYILRVTMLQEFVRWLDEAPTQLMEDVPIAIISKP
ncbi:methyltransferase domain-containing protein [Chlorogloeopsis sp. ULAP02]|uniref:methyltransferase domain-containing protein n=1 Tax=Chlorogloeopsis sp. ULAP02 TaxID=3107926 RepID=UPI0031376837